MTPSPPQQPSTTTNTAVEEALLLLNLRNGAMKEFQEYRAKRYPSQTASSGSTLNKPQLSLASSTTSATDSPTNSKSTESTKSLNGKRIRKKSTSKTESEGSTSKTESMTIENNDSPPPLLTVRTNEGCLVPRTGTAGSSISPNVALKLKDFPDPPEGPVPPLSICVKPARAADHKYLEGIKIPRTLNTTPYKYKVRLNVATDVFKKRELLFRVRRADSNQIVLYNKRPKKRKRKNDDDSDDSASDLQPAINWHLHDFFPLNGGFQLTYQVTLTLCSFHYNKTAFYIELWSRTSPQKNVAQHDQLPEQDIEQQTTQGDRTTEDKDTDRLELLYRFPAIELLARKRKEQDLWQERGSTQQEEREDDEEEEGLSIKDDSADASSIQSTSGESPEHSNSSISHDDGSSQPFKKRRMT